MGLSRNMYKNEFAQEDDSVTEKNILGQGGGDGGPKSSLQILVK